MAVKITNRAGHLLIIPLNSGATIHLASGEVSEPVEEYELESNEHVSKLLAGELIRVSGDEPASPAEPKPDAG